MSKIFSGVHTPWPINVQQGKSRGLAMCLPHTFLCSFLKGEGVLENMVKIGAKSARHLVVNCMVVLQIPTCEIYLK